jgi:uncharacterized RDD family membrane protein YckC
MKCRECGHANEAKYDRCGHCGALLPKPEPVSTSKAKAKGSKKPRGKRELTHALDDGRSATYKVVGLEWRMLAYIVDLFFSLIFGAALGYAALASGEVGDLGSGTLLDSLKNLPTSTLVNLVIAGRVLYIVFEILMTSSRYQATFGKMICDMRVISTNGRKISAGKAFTRLLLRDISIYLLAPAVISTFTITGNARHRALHDMLAGTLVVKKRGL